jgi:hypothetical protein
MGEDGDETKLPPLYTRPGDIDAVESVLRQLHERPGPHTNAGRDMFRVYSVCKLFHELRNASMSVPSTVILSHNFLAEHELHSAALQFTEGISRDFREELEAVRHCSLAHAQRCSFLIMEQFCWLLAVEMVPGKHCDFSTYLTKRARAVCLLSRARCWNPNTLRHDMPSSRSLSGEPLSSKHKCQEATLMQTEPMQQVRAEEVVRPRWLRPLRPLRTPREPVEMSLMCTILRQKGRSV